MNNTSKNFNEFLVIGIILVVALLRIIPHYPNVTPLAAIALLGGAAFRKKWLAFLIPMAALLLSDMYLGFHEYMIPVYASFILIVCIGLLVRKISILKVFFASIGASTLFFLVTNFSVWAGSTFYPQTFAGLISCYAAGLPFYYAGLAGDLFYSGLVFGAYFFMHQRLQAFDLRKINQPAP